MLIRKRLLMKCLFSASVFYILVFMFTANVAKVAITVANKMQYLPYHPLCTEGEFLHNRTTNCSSGDLVGFKCESCAPGSPCAQLKQNISSFPADKVKAAIYVLAGGFYKGALETMIESVYRNFNKNYRYPVIIFHECGFERDLALPDEILRDVVFQELEFEDPDYATEPRHVSCSKSRRGYNRMCRFHARMVYEHPLIRDLDYVMRLDDDSEILGPEMTYDVFARMRDAQAQYGYRVINMEDCRCIRYLNANVTKYIQDRNISPGIFNYMKNRQFYNNFEISSVPFFRSQNYTDFFDYLDKTSGFYSYRWGDAPVKTYGVSLFANVNKIEYFEFDYFHLRRQKPEKYKTFKEFIDWFETTNWLVVSVYEFFTNAFNWQ